MNNKLRKKIRLMGESIAENIFEHFLDNRKNHAWLNGVVLDQDIDGNWMEVRYKKVVKEKIASMTMLAAMPVVDALNEAIKIIGDMIDDEPCQFDQHGYCQTHGWLYTEPKCPQARAKEFLEKYE